jgi:uncharacterized protein YndB with AHSA1/START domain
MADQVSVSREIAAPPERVWALIADLPRMGEWSPECTGGRWIGEPQGPEVGARFRGTNQSGRKRWSTRSQVSESAAPEVFAFDVSAVGLGVARWHYRIEPVGAGCRVTETWTDRRSPFMRRLGTLASGVADRAEHNRRGMDETLRRVAEAAESAAV